MSKRARLADFKKRADGDPGSVYELGERGRFVAVHPMSDELRLLDRLAVRPQSCIVVDLYWEVGDDVVFVQIESAAYAEPRPIGTYIRQAGSGYLNVVVVVPDKSISSVRVIGELTALAPIILALDRRVLEDRLVPLARD